MILKFLTYEHVLLQSMVYYFHLLLLHCKKLLEDFHLVSLVLKPVV